jgi:DNA invertase Pin-like site-specific DNA recombinase
MNAYAYLRVSGLGQVSGDGFTRQRQEIEDYAILHDLRIVHWYEERGVTGKADTDERPALRQLLEELNGTRTVIVERLDRLARDLIIQEGILSKFKAAGVELISTAEPDLCSEDPTRIFIRQVLGAVAQLDRSLIVKKLRAARDRQRAANGKCEGRKAFGERPEEALMLRQIREWSAKGFNAAVIADKLNFDQVPTRSGVPWRASVVRKILQRTSKTSACLSDSAKLLNFQAEER